MLATTVYTLVSQNRVLPKYRNALVLSSMVTFIAAYHYLRIFDSYKEATTEGTFTVVTDFKDSPAAFNEGYRYVDWILTVPLLLVEVIAVLALAKEAARSLITRLVPASAGDGGDQLWLQLPQADDLGTYQALRREHKGCRGMELWRERPT